MPKKILVGLLSLTALVVAWWLISPFWRTIELDESLPTPSPAENISENEELSSTFELGRAAMIAQAHEVEGEALLVQSGEETFLRFENLKTIDGPDLRIYLASDLKATDIVDLGPIRATAGNVNYEIPTGTDLEKYKKVLIWCRAFKVLFSYAEL